MRQFYVTIRFDVHTVIALGELCLSFSYVVLQTCLC